jgi:hypothetical protein
MTTARLGHPAHDHRHGEWCGHVAVPHGDPVDDIADGNRDDR